MKRILPLSLVCLSAVWIYACSDDKAEPSDTTTQDGGGGTEQDSGGTTTDEDGGTKPNDSGTPDAPVVTTSNPVEGASAAKIITPNDFDDFADGPIFRNGKLYYTLPLSSIMVEYAPPSTFTPVRDYNALNPKLTPIGQTFDPKTSTVVTTEAEISMAPTTSRLVRSGSDAGATTAITLTYDAGVSAFESPNDVVARADGTLYVTDPGYQKQLSGGATTNRIYRIAANNQAFVEKEFALSEKPNGIALSPDGNTLYVSLTDRNKVVKYPIAANGILGAESDFVTGVTQPDGLCVDTAGNLYVTTATGVSVHKADGTKWGAIDTKKGGAAVAATGVAFGGTDMKTLYVTAEGAVFEVTGLKVAGTAQ